MTKYYTPEESSLYKEKGKQIQNELRNIEALNGKLYPNINLIVDPKNENTWTIMEYNDEFEFGLNLSIDVTYNNDETVIFSCVLNGLPPLKWFNPVPYSNDSIIFPKYVDNGLYREVSTVSNIRHAKYAFQATIDNARGAYKQWDKCRVRQFLRRRIIDVANKIQNIGMRICSKV